MKISLFKIAGLMVVALATYNSALALPFIDGEIELAAYGANANVNFMTNKVTFKISPTNHTGANAQVTSDSGDYSTYLNVADKAKYSDFNYGAAPGLVVPSVLLWKTIAPSYAASFTLTSITSIIEDSVNSKQSPGTSLDLQGEGIAHLLGFADTVGLWSFSANSTGAIKFSFSSTNVSSVPESGMTALMLGVGLIGVGVASRRSKKAVQA